METLLTLLAEHDALVVFLATLAARIGLPVPAAPLLIVAGSLGATGQSSLPPVLMAAIAANVLGDSPWFLAGRRYGHRVLRTLCRVSLAPDSCVRQSESLIERWGGSSLVAAKFVPGVSVVAAPMAGAMGMSLRRFVAFDGVAGALWAAAFIALGIVFSAQVQELLNAMAHAGLLAAALLALALAAFVAQRAVRRWRFMRQVGLPRVSADELHRMIERGAEPVILDVRSAAHARLDPRQIPGALRVDLADIGTHAGSLPRDRDIVLYCNCPHEASAAKAAYLLVQSGLRRARPLAGGLDGWVDGGRPVALAGVAVAD